MEHGLAVRQAMNAPGEQDAWWWFFWLLQTTQGTLFKDGKPGFLGGEGELTLQFMKDLQDTISLSHARTVVDRLLHLPWNERLRERFGAAGQIIALPDYDLAEAAG